MGSDAAAVIEVAASSTIGDFEQRLEEVAMAPRAADLLLPSQLKRRFFAGTATQMQLIATWARTCPEGRLRIHAPDRDEEGAKAVLENFLESDHGLFGASLAGAWTRRGERDLSKEARQLADRRLAAICGAERWSEHKDMKDKAFVACLDDSSYEEPLSLYQPRRDPEAEPTCRDLEDFRGLAKDVLDRLWKDPGGGSSIDPLRLPDSRPLGVLLFELFRNTHFWARSDADGGTYLNRSSLRGLRFDRHNFEISGEEAMIAGQRPLEEFFRSPVLVPRDRRRRVVELTIFDSGPGIAARALADMRRAGKAGDVTDEREAFFKCLRKHFTSDRSKHPKGEGLHAALDALSTLRSFLWVRSGRLSAYRNFIDMPYDPEGGTEEPFLLDWKSGSTVATEMAPVDGAFITALIPITYDAEQTSL